MYIFRLIPIHHFPLGEKKKKNLPSIPSKDFFLKKRLKFFGTLRNVIIITKK